SARSPARAGRASAARPCTGSGRAGGCRRRAGRGRRTDPTPRRARARRAPRARGSVDQHRGRRALGPLLLVEVAGLPGGPLATLIDPILDPLAPRLALVGLGLGVVRAARQERVGPGDERLRRARVLPIALRAGDARVPLALPRFALLADRRRRE